MSEACDAPPVAPVVIYCDLCTEDRRPAQKTCVRCEMSMCTEHLQDHLTVPALKRHPLSQPMAPRQGVTECPHHGKLVEYYCLDDLTVACVSCAIEDEHHRHNMKTFPNAHRELGEKLKVAQTALAQTERKCLVLESWEKRQRGRLNQFGARVIEAVSNLRDLALTSVQSSVSARAAAVRAGKSSVRAALGEEDAFSFLQGFAGAHQAAETAQALSLGKGLEPGEDREKLVLEVRQSGFKVREQVERLWASLLAHVDPDHHGGAGAAEAPTGASDGTTELTFDPKTLGKGMSLSKDLTKVFYHSPLDPHTLLLQRSSSDVINHSRWMVKLPEDYDWIIGLCDETYPRMCPNQTFGNLDNVYVYALCWQDNQLSSLSTQSYVQTVFTADKSPWSSPKKERRLRPQVTKVQGSNGDEDIPRPGYVEVVWDIPSASLSFYSRAKYSQRTELHTVRVEASALTPFVTVGTVDAATRRPKQPEHLWSCPCGKDHQQKHGYTGRIPPYPGGSQQPPCSCGRAVFTPHTQLLCKLVHIDGMMW